VWGAQFRSCLQISHFVASDRVCVPHALVEAATHACTHPAYRDQQTKARIGKQRGTKVAQIDLARRLTEAIWHMPTRDQPFAPKGATDPLAA
jgi:transposase